MVLNCDIRHINDEKELPRSLQGAKIARVGRDVFENEPGVPKELGALDNVILSPPLAFYAREALWDMFEHVKGNLQAFFSNEALLFPVLD